MPERLIDANALLKKCIEGDGDDEFTEGYNCAVQEISADIKNAPTVNARPVVLCGECKHMMPNGFCEEFADRGIRPSVSDFCSYGERMDDNG